MYPFAEKLPRDDAVALWALQQHLLQQAELRFGCRDVGKEICQPTFHNGAPHIMNRRNGSGAWVILSSNAGGYWPTAMYELAHETVHLLNPITGGARYLEEGLAVKFSVDMSATTDHAMAPADGLYKNALDWVLELPGDPYEIGKACRERFGSLDQVTTHDLMTICPSVSRDLANRLCERP